MKNITCRATDWGKGENRGVEFPRACGKTARYAYKVEQEGYPGLFRTSHLCEEHSAQFDETIASDDTGAYDTTTKRRLRLKCEVEGCQNDADVSIRVATEGEHKGQLFDACAEHCTVVAPGEPDSEAESIEALERLYGKE